MTYYMMNESEARNVLILINRELAQLDGQHDFMSKHDREILTKLKENLISAFPAI